MSNLIDKSVVVAEINKKKIPFKRDIEDGYYPTYLCALMDFEDFINTLEVQEVDFEEEYAKYSNDINAEYAFPIDLADYKEFAKHFFELGMCASNPIISADRGTAEEIIINLKRVEKDYRINLTREIEWLRNKVKKGK